ncbi:SDR family oxidoreductase [Microtetraspora sp. NBRC 16547]|uniref:SDR family NAD(P)-dependent oxidoreductase n=1 Tax=Microtetraspora sp. NBRC 16547 TaxID=3030993 RepID=UPI0024A0EA8E|nr:SDR family oxidoreductase [Microtetraspora sp. NBRC 16547]GLW98290.1 2-deoxy-D-gluconate 3-dehydrogenase [Microtetraspora sp. NBRC 16547]
MVAVDHDALQEISSRMSRAFDVSGQRVLLVGGASGLGEAMACGFSTLGARVAVADVNLEKAEGLASVLNHMGGEVSAWQLDVQKTDDVASRIAEIAKSLGGLDTAVNLAGINDRRPALDLDSAAFSRILAVNLEGVYACARAEGAVMTQAGSGSIINISSIYAFAPAQNQAPYAASKGGVLSLTRVLANEWATKGVRVNALVPGPILTPLSRANLVDDPDTRAWMEARIMRHRAGEPSEIVGPAVFLASDAASFVTGVGLPVDGGWLAA